jgi:thiamine pyrophosphate-dependent acetolactate synthase large subunit-like protein/rubredoxin
MTDWKCPNCGHVSTGESPPEECPECGASEEGFSLLKKDTEEKKGGRTVSDVIVDQLAACGVKYVFGIPGYSCLGVVEAIRKHPDLEFILVRHEQTAAMAASAYAKTSGKVGVCLTIAGPGATNLMTGLYDAKMDRAPVLALTGQVGLQYIGPGSFQEIDQMSLFEAVSVFNQTLSSKEQTTELVALALKHAVTERGVAHLSLPNDVQEQEWDEEPKPMEGRIAPKQVVPSSSLIEKAVDLVKDAERPVIIAGWGALGEPEQVKKLAEKIGAPVACTYRAKGIIPDDDEHGLGVLGFSGTPLSRKYANASDLLVVLGSSFSELTKIPDRPILQVDFDPMMISKQAPVTLGLVGEMSVTLPALIDAFPQKEKYFSEKLTEDKGKFRERLTKEARETIPMRPQYIIRELTEVIDEEAIITVDSGDNTHWFGRNFVTKKQRILISGYLGTMAFGLPASLGAQLAEPDRQVVCITGDGGFGMAMADFTTAVSFDLPINVVVFNNNALGMIRWEQELDGYPNYSTDLRNPNFADYATSSGGAGFRVEEPSQLRPALEKALASDKPTLVDVVTDPMSH